ncbi:terminase large subunit [Microbacterium sp. cx-55]|uniref:terminase large subunit domain-containing protein n=1 Tax=Microbacterium sp. cx-55 TaxID=2875948 RepID=UPI001CBDA51C|nr:terminase large subunit [Microbacterium sp. cx-55]MBZ4485969.1 hypothetical protein [Microbacterium sp. cx-55]UGB34157.1 terminase large subunit [Microbacterium sp. cx-55]
MSAPPFADIKPWPPTRYTAPLSPDFPSALDPWLPVLRIVWAVAFGYWFENWQVALLRAVLEVYPEGHPRAGQLRYRQVVISVARQNGKSEIAAALGLWRLLSKAGALVIGIASSAEQARIIYDRAMLAINANPSLSKMFDRLTDTRGIRKRDGGRWELKASKSAALQGLPIDLGLVDELHVIRRALWFDLVNGTGGRPNCLVAGITTAGDAESDLLIDLYKLADHATADADTRFGVFIWEAPEDRVPDDDETLGRWLAMANPVVASGLSDLETVISDARTNPDPELIRYRLNRFLQSVRAPFIPPDKWHAVTRRESEAFPATRAVFTFDATPGLSFATITATARGEDGTVHSEIVGSVRNPTIERLASIASHLMRHNPITFAVDGYLLRRLGIELQRRGYPVMIGSQSDAISSAALLYRLVAAGTFRHAGDPLLSRQIPLAIRRNVGDSFTISRTDSSIEIDAVKATALGALALEVTPNRPRTLMH